MKKIFTICVCFLATTTMFAQNANLPQPLKLKRVANLQQPPKQGINHRDAGSRAICESLFLQYNSYEDFWATNRGLNFNGGFNGAGLYGGEMTPFVDTFHSYMVTNIKAVFDTLAFLVDDGSGNIATSFLPKAATTVSIDSLGMYVSLEGDSALMADDSLVFTIYKRVGTVETQVKRVVEKGPSWFEQYYSDGTGIPYVQIPIGYQLLKGEGFAIKMQYYGKDTSSHFTYTYAFTDSCGTIDFQGQTLTSPAYKSPFGTMSYSGEIRPNANGTAAVSNSNNNFAYNIPGVPAACRFVYEQIYNLFPILTVCSDYGVSIVPAQTTGCPNGTVDLSAAPLGTTSTNLTYTWSATNGTLSTTSDPTTTLTLGSSGNATVTLTINDGVNGDVSDTFTIINSGINISINNSNPITLACGNSVTINTTATGVTAGKTYIWSNQATSQNITTSTSGVYAVTVTNNKGCTASASVNVNYNAGITNTVDFTIPSGACFNAPATYVNTSTFTAGWNATWDMDNNGLTLITTTDATHAYSATGFHQIKLKMDSAGCVFTSPIDNAHRVNIQFCVGVEDLSFSNLVSIVPNPSHGNVTITVNGIEQNISIKIYNVIGSEVKSFNANDVATSFTKTLDLNDLSNGTYLVKIQTADKTAIKRLVVSK